MLRQGAPLGAADRSRLLDGNGTDTVGVVTSTALVTWLLNNENDDSGPDVTFEFGGTGIVPIVWAS